MTTSTTVADVLATSLRPVRAQLDLAISQTSGTARQVHAKCMGLVKDWEQQQKRSEAA